MTHSLFHLNVKQLVPESDPPSPSHCVCSFIFLVIKRLNVLLGFIYLHILVTNKKSMNVIFVSYSDEETTVKGQGLNLCS